MRRGLSQFLSIAAIPMTLLYAFAFALSYTDTCTQGAADGFAAGIICGGIVAVITTSMLVASRRVDGVAAWSRLGIPALLLILIAMASKHLIATMIYGHHLCGPEFDSMLVEYRGWEQDAFWPLQLAYMCFMSLSAAWPVIPISSSRRRAQHAV